MKNFVLVSWRRLARAGSTPKEADSNELSELNWLEGNWVRTNDSQAEITYEKWI